MGHIFASSQEVANDTLVTTAETVVCTLDGISTPGRRTVRVKGWVQVTTGTGATTLTPRIRRGTGVTGTLIDEANAITLQAAAGGTEELELTAEDEGVDLANASYVLTVQQAAATGNGTALQAAMEASWPE